MYSYQGLAVIAGFEMAMVEDVVVSLLVYLRQHGSMR
jgi:hypothetical protein